MVADSTWKGILISCFLYSSCLFLFLYFASSIYRLMFNSLNDIDATLKKKDFKIIFDTTFIYFVYFCSIFSTSYLFLNYNFDVLKIFFFIFKMIYCIFTYSPFASSWWILNLIYFLITSRYRFFKNFFLGWHKILYIDVDYCEQVIWRKYREILGLNVWSKRVFTIIQMQKLPSFWEQMFIHRNSENDYLVIGILKVFL